MIYSILAFPVTVNLDFKVTGLS